MRPSLYQGRSSGPRSRGDPGRPARQRDHVAEDELAAAAGLDLAVDRHGAVRDQRLGLGPGLDQVRELQELTQADRLVADRDVGGVLTRHCPSPRTHPTTKRRGRGAPANGNLDPSDRPAPPGRTSSFQHRAPWHLTQRSSTGQGSEEDAGGPEAGRRRPGSPATVGTHLAGFQALARHLGASSRAAGQGARSASDEPRDPARPRASARPVSRLRRPAPAPPQPRESAPSTPSPRWGIVRGSDYPWSPLKWSHGQRNTTDPDSPPRCSSRVHGRRNRADQAEVRQLPGRGGVGGDDPADYLAPPRRRCRTGLRRHRHPRRRAGRAAGGGVLGRRVRRRPRA